MYIRKTVESDLPRVLEIYARARAFMAETGNPRQWGPTRWPPEALLRQDIARGRSYVCVDGGDVVGTFYFAAGPDIEPTYRDIAEGAWLEDGPYGVVHRIASDGSRRGVGRFCLDWALEKCGHLRIDTHPDNRVMQGLLEKLGFSKRGIIHVLEDDDPRYAYEKICRDGAQPPRAGRGSASMKIAVSYENGQIFQHFGHTPQFKLYEVRDGQITASRIVDTQGSGHGALAGFLQAAGADILICGGIGAGARAALAEAGIRLCAGVQGPADEAAAALAAGTLEFDPEARCDHHQHQAGDCGRGHCADHHCSGN